MKPTVSVRTTASGAKTRTRRIRSVTVDFVLPASHQRNQPATGIQKSNPSKGRVLARMAIPMAEQQKHRVSAHGAQFATSHPAPARADGCDSSTPVAIDPIACNSEFQCNPALRREVPTLREARPATSKESRRTSRQCSKARRSMDVQAIDRAPGRPLAPADTSTNMSETN